MAWVPNGCRTIGPHGQRHSEDVDSVRLTFLPLKFSVFLTTSSFFFLMLLKKSKVLFHLRRVVNRQLDLTCNYIDVSKADRSYLGKHMKEKP